MRLVPKARLWMPSEQLVRLQVTEHVFHEFILPPSEQLFQELQKRLVHRVQMAVEHKVNPLMPSKQLVRLENLYLHYTNCASVL